MNEEKDKLQKEAVTLFEGNRNILLSWATGCSKSLAAIKCADSWGIIDIPEFASRQRVKWVVYNIDDNLDVTCEEKDILPSILIVVAEELHKDNWREEFKKWNYEHLLKNCIIECYASLQKHVGKSYNICIWDECHHISELKSELIQGIEIYKNILLSATLATDIAARIKESVGEYAEMHVSLDDAIERGILPKPRIYKVEVELDDRFKRHHTTFGKKKAILTDKGMYKKMSGQMDRWSEMKSQLEEDGKPSGWIDRKMITLGGERKKFLASCKTEGAKKLLASLSGKRILCFTGSTEQCEELGGVNSLNSSRGTKHNKLTLKKFNDKEIDEIYVNKMLKEGQNLNDIEVGVVVQLDSGNDAGLSTVQRLGRILRAKEPIIYIMYVKGTSDERYMSKAIQQVASKFIVN